MDCIESFGYWYFENEMRYEGIISELITWYEKSVDVGRSTIAIVAA